MDKILIIYGSLNSVPSPEGAAPAKVIEETVLSSSDIEFEVISHYNSNLSELDYNSRLFKHIKTSVLDSIILLIIKLFYNYKKRRLEFVTGNDKQLKYFIAVCRSLFFKKNNKIIVHVSVGLVLMIKKVFPKKRIVFYHHGTSLHTKLNEYQWGKLTDSVDAIFGVNKIAIQRANETFKRQYPIKKYFGIDNAIRFDESYRSKHDLVDSQDINVFEFVFTGRICVEKGVLNLLKAFEQVYYRNKNTKLTIIGGSGTNGKRDVISNYFQQCIDFVNKKSLPVEFTGFLPKVRLMQILISKDVFVFSTDFKLSEEGMPLSILEALSLSKPVIATNSGGVNEVINNKNGFLVKSYPYIDEFSEYMMKISEDL